MPEDPRVHEFRGPGNARILDGRYTHTGRGDGAEARGDEFFKRAVAAVRAFDDFTPENDPHDEHDMAFLDVDGVRIFFKVDYYDAALEMHSPDPSDPGVTRRVLTIALAEEY